MCNDMYNVGMRIPSLLWYNLFDFLSLGLVRVYTSMGINPTIEQVAIVGLGMALGESTHLWKCNPSTVWLDMASLDSTHIHSPIVSLYRFACLGPMVDVDLSNIYYACMYIYRVQCHGGVGLPQITHLRVGWKRDTTLLCTPSYLEGLIDCY